MVLAPFPALFRSLRQRGSAPASFCSGLSIGGLIDNGCDESQPGLTCAETEVRVRVRWRVVTVHVQRGQIRVVSVVATDEPTGRPHSAAAFLFMSPLSGGVSKNSTSPARGYSDSRVLLAAGMDFCFIGDKTSPLHLSLILPSEVYYERARLAPRVFVLASPSGRGSAALAGRAVFVVALRAPLPSI